VNDDLVKRLRQWDCGESTWGLLESAADRIETLEAELHHCFHRIEELQAALRDLCDGWECCPVSQAMRRVARKALEGKDD
jgi:hypothetical protein